MTRWELALREGQDLLLLGEGEYYGFGVDAGMGCFFDFSALDALQALAAEAEDSLIGTKDDEGCLLTDPISGATLIAYRSGFGDGLYPTWIGRTAAGEIASFVSDMLLLDEAMIQ